MDYFFTGLIWFFIGAIVMYAYMRNKTSINPHSYRDELAALEAKYNELRKKYEDRK